MSGANSSTRNGYKRPRLKSIWFNMRNRCYNPNVPSFRTYGALGIRICEEWMNFEVFAAWAASSGYRDNLTIERKDNDKGYEPGNCTWIPKQEQSLNQRTNVRIRAFGEEKTKSEWAKDPRCVVSVATLHYRLIQGRNPEEAITSPEWTNLKRSTVNGRHMVVSAFGEQKITAQWAKDPRCQVKADTLDQRLRDGWKPERAIATPTLIKYRPVKD